MTTLENTSRPNYAGDVLQFRPLMENLAVFHFFALQCKHHISFVFNHKMPFFQIGTKTLKFTSVIFIIFLPNNDNLCIEFNGLTSKTYLRSKEYTLKIYEQLGLNVLILTSEDIENGFRELKKILKIF